MLPVLGRPTADEVPSFFAGYVARVPETDILDVLQSQSSAVRMLLGNLSEARAGFRYAPGKWSIKEVVGHLADAERIISYRALRFGRADETPLAGFEENDYVENAGSDRQTLATLLDELEVLRSATLYLFRNFDAPAWQRRGTANGASISVRGLAFAIAGHQRHHLETLRERYLPLAKESGK